MSVFAVMSSAVDDFISSGRLRAEISKRKANAEICREITQAFGFKEPNRKRNGWMLFCNDIKAEQNSLAVIRDKINIYLYTAVTSVPVI